MPALHKGNSLGSPVPLKTQVPLVQQWECPAKQSLPTTSEPQAPWADPMETRHHCRVRRTAGCPTTVPAAPPAPSLPPSLGGPPARGGTGALAEGGSRA